MLISCPECQHDVSDKAVSCPNCGYPIQSNGVPAKRNTSRPKRFRRLPNGFGSIKHLSGNRRKPYAAYPATKEWTGTSPKSQKAIGYFETYNDAFQALTEYNKNPYDLDNAEISFEGVYNGFFDWKKGNVGKSSQASYRTAYRYFDAIKNSPFRKLKTQDLQSVVDGIPYGYATSDNCKKLLVGMYKYAIQNDIVSTNYATYIVIKKENDIEHGVPFTEDDLKRLWKLKDDPDGMIVNIMIYTGLRIGELQGYKYRDGMIQGGIKSEAGRNRIIPVIEDIKPLVESFDNFHFQRRTFRNDNHIYRIFEEANCLYAPTGEKHTSHDCRHTFSWLADKYGMDEVSKHLIMGHSLGSDVERNTYGHRTTEQLVEEMNKIKIIV